MSRFFISALAIINSDWSSSCLAREPPSYQNIPLLSRIQFRRSVEPFLRRRSCSNKQWPWGGVRKSSSVFCWRCQNILQAHFWQGQARSLYRMTSFDPDRERAARRTAGIARPCLKSLCIGGVWDEQCLLTQLAPAQFRALEACLWKSRRSIFCKRRKLISIKEARREP